MTPTTADRSLEPFAERRKCANSRHTESAISDFCLVLTLMFNRQAQKNPHFAGHAVIAGLILACALTKLGLEVHVSY
jgi:hypothetical protein